MTAVPQAVRALCRERDGGLCVRCGAPATNLHHREGRGAGGRGKAEAARTNGPAWLLSLCGLGNTSGCHRWCDENRPVAEAQGYVIRRNGLPVQASRRRVLTLDGWQRFTDDGRRLAMLEDGAA